MRATPARPFADSKPPTAFALRPRRPGRYESLREQRPTAELSYDPAIKFLLRFFASVLALPTAGHAQSGVRPQPTPTTPTQTPADGVARLFNERAHIFVFTADERGRLHPSLDIPDAPPPAVSVRRIRADVPPPSPAVCGDAA